MHQNTLMKTRKFMFLASCAAGLLTSIPVSLSASELDAARSRYVESVLKDMRGRKDLYPLRLELATAQEALKDIQQRRDAALKEHDYHNMQTRLDKLQKAIGDLSVEHEKTLKALEVKSQDAKKRLQAANLQIEVKKSKLSELENAKQKLQAKIDEDFRPNFEKAEDAHENEKANVDHITHLIDIITADKNPASNEEITEYVFSSYRSELYLKALKEGFFEGFADALKAKFGGDLENSRQIRFADYTNDGTIVFSDVPKGDAWLLWDERRNLPLQAKDQSDYFEKPVFIRIPVKGPSEFDIIDLKRVPLEDVSGGRWSTDTDNDYDNCLHLNDVDTSSENAVMQMCQDLFPDTARGAIMVSGNATAQRRLSGILMSGEMAEIFADAHTKYMSELKKLASRSVPETLLPFLTEELDDKLYNAKRALGSGLITRTAQ